MMLSGLVSKKERGGHPVGGGIPRVALLIPLLLVTVTEAEADAVGR